MKVCERKAWRRTDDYTPGTAKVKLVTEKLPLSLAPSEVLIKVHAVALNYRDANIANGGNPWPVTPNGVLGNDAAGEVVEVGDKVKSVIIGDRVAPITDTENISGREPNRSWLAADEDGVLADYIVFEEQKICKLPDYLDWVTAAIIPCAGVTAWSALKGVGVGKTALIQGKCFMRQILLPLGVLTLKLRESDSLRFGYSATFCEPEQVCLLLSWIRIIQLVGILSGISRPTGLASRRFGLKTDSLLS